MADISELQQLLASKDAEIECLQTQLMARGGTADANTERDQEYQRLKAGMESLLASNGEKERRIEELTILLGQYRKMREVMALTQGVSDEDLSGSSGMSSLSSSPFVLSSSPYQRGFDSSIHDSLHTSLVSTGDTSFCNGSWHQRRLLSSSLEELQSGSLQKNPHMELSRYQTLPGKPMRNKREQRARKHGDGEGEEDVSPGHCPAAGSTTGLSHLSSSPRVFTSACSYLSSFTLPIPAPPLSHVRASTSTTYVRASTSTTYVRASTSTTYVRASTSTTYVRASTSTTYVRASTSTTYVRASTSTTYVRASTSTTYVRASTSTTYVRASTSTTYVRASISTTYVRASTSTTYVRASTSTTYVRASTSTTYVRASTSTTYVRASTSTTLRPGQHLHQLRPCQHLHYLRPCQHLHQLRPGQHLHQLRPGQHLHYLHQPEKLKECVLSDQSPLSSGVDSGQQSPVLPENRKSQRGIRKLWGKIRHSQSGSPAQGHDPELGELKRGGFRATAGPRLAPSGNPRDLKMPFCTWSKEQVCDWLEEIGTRPVWRPRLPLGHQW
ncbi:hypothetical protein KUCAC02_021819 [Chaenocephalus aceratus]|uniref:Uncharacterized protein n=1 Tax=Chaenocephalus aceratus TaxID=36190 RepID=A0ACB9XIM0_CHAAC|nr:hypothetical protein KUCAC02_021819 [Chaenocephalus aceratus]